MLRSNDRKNGFYRFGSHQRALETQAEMFGLGLQSSKEPLHVPEQDCTVRIVFPRSVLADQSLYTRSLNQAI